MHHHMSPAVTPRVVCREQSALASIKGNFNILAYLTFPWQHISLCMHLETLAWPIIITQLSLMMWPRYCIFVHHIWSAIKLLTIMTTLFLEFNLESCRSTQLEQAQSSCCTTAIYGNRKTKSSTYIWWLMTLWVGNNVINPTDDNNNKSDELLLPFAPNYAICTKLCKWWHKSIFTSILTMRSDWLEYYNQFDLTCI